MSSEPCRWKGKFVTKRVRNAMLQRVANEKKSKKVRSPRKIGRCSALNLQRERQPNSGHASYSKTNVL